MHRIGIVAKPTGVDLVAVLGRVRRWAEGAGVTLFGEVESLPAGHGLRALAPDQPLDLLLSLGGDGTLLRAARLRAGEEVPVLGVNLGQLGFLTTVGGAEMEAALDRVIRGEYSLDRRFTLEASVLHGDGSNGRSFLALNDFVIHKGGVARVTRLDLAVGVGEGRDEIGSFSGDGVILSTPTGSTAYSLSAGGPIIVPEVDCIVVTPIAPHTLAVRPLVIPAADVVEVRAVARSEELVLTVDGQFGVELEAGDSVRVGRGAVTVPIVRFPGQTFFATLRRKLNWAVPPTH